MITPVILSGGSGTRLWPLSRELFPKQLINLQGGVRGYVDSPPGGPDWGLRFAITFMFPK